MLRRIEAGQQFSIAEARSLVRDLFEPKIRVYWFDFLASLAAGLICFFGMRTLAVGGIGVATALPLAAAYTICVLAFYRASLFTHELTHLRKDSFRAFRIVWNLFYGIPFLVPSFLYHTHVDHHARRQYGTARDGEYLSLAQGPRWRIFWYLSESLVVPLIAVARFAAVPVGWFSPRFRAWLARHASSMVIDPNYVRPLPTRQELKLWRLQETACFVWIVEIGILLATGVLPPGFVINAYAVSVGVMLINSVRTLGAHRYRSLGEPLTFVEQLLDSVNYPRWPWLAELWAPVGLRFHALHHLFPSMPYHNLAEAHDRLMANLPADSPYRSTVSHSLWGTILQLWREAGAKAEKKVTSIEPRITRRRVTA